MSGIILSHPTQLVELRSVEAFKDCVVIKVRAHGSREGCISVRITGLALVEMVTRCLVQRNDVPTDLIRELEEVLKERTLFDD